MALAKDATFLAMGDHLGTGLGEVAVDGCSSARGNLASGADGNDKGDHPKKTW